jgi:hypothetical protein
MRLVLVLAVVVMVAAVLVNRLTLQGAQRNLAATFAVCFSPTPSRPASVVATCEQRLHGYTALRAAGVKQREAEQRKDAQLDARVKRLERRLAKLEE